MFSLLSADLFDYLNKPTIVSIQPQRCTQSCNWKLLLESVQNNKLRFREEEISVLSPDEFPRLVSPGLPPRPVLGFRIVIENPPELIQLSRTNDTRILDELLRLLNYRDRAWAANVLLGKMMGLVPIDIEVDILHNKVDFSKYDIKSVSPEKWWEAEGKTLHAKKAWITYLRKVRPTMKWNQHNGYYRYTAPSGRKVL
jgi:hypothetical protein